MSTPRGLPSSGPRLQRFLHRRRFYPQLARIVARKLIRREPRDRVFVSLMGGVGDLVNAFPSLEALARGAPVELATGQPPYRTLAEASPHLARVHAPFVYKPIRRRHRRLIERVLAPFYARVILLDNADDRWWARGRHIAATYAERCGVPAPAAGTIYLSDAHRAEAERYARARELGAFVYVAQVIRARRPFRSWPLRHYHALYHLLRRATDAPIVVDTTGSDETAIPSFCRRLDRLDILVAAARAGAALRRPRLGAHARRGRARRADGLHPPRLPAGELPGPGPDGAARRAARALRRSREDDARGGLRGRGAGVRRRAPARAARGVTR